MMLKLIDTSQKFIILGKFILDKVTRLRPCCQLDPPPPQDGVSEFTGRYPLAGGKAVDATNKYKADFCPDVLPP